MVAHGGGTGAYTEPDNQRLGRAEAVDGWGSHTSTSTVVLHSHTSLSITEGVEQSVPSQTSRRPTTPPCVKDNVTTCNEHTHTEGKLSTCRCDDGGMGAAARRMQ